mmetsp:Transcript_13472/g.39761  ORF Transcript_13472/g.39761 Transcript_13472/m.39761 type:complete len:229 (+) Transcript_13472:203-889(+)
MRSAARCASTTPRGASSCACSTTSPRVPSAQTRPSGSRRGTSPTASACCSRGTLLAPRGAAASGSIGSPSGMPCSAGTCLRRSVPRRSPCSHRRCSASTAAAWRSSPSPRAPILARTRQAPCSTACGRCSARTARPLALAPTRCRCCSRRTRSFAAAWTTRYPSPWRRAPTRTCARRSCATRLTSSRASPRPPSAGRWSAWTGRRCCPWSTRAPCRRWAWPRCSTSRR